MLTSNANEMGTESEAELAARLRLAVTRLARRLRQEAGSGLSPSQAAALATIEKRGSLTPSELASAERIQRPTASRIIAALEVAGLVGRTQDPADGRVSVVAATGEGRRLLRRLRSRKNAYVARRLQRFDAHERAVLAEAATLLERLLEEPA